MLPDDLAERSKRWCSLPGNWTHDQPKADRLDESAQSWLHGLGITDAAGHVRASMADKFSQINRYLEIVAPARTVSGSNQREGGFSFAG